MKQQVTITKTDLSGLKTLFTEVENSIKSYIDDRLANQSADKLFTREQTAKHLDVDLSTLWKWSKTGKLPSYGIGSRTYYKLSDIEEALIPLNSSYGNKKGSKSSTVGDSVSKNSKQ